MDLQKFLLATFGGCKTSFEFSYKELKRNCENRGYNISTFYNDVKRVLTLMFINEQVKKFYVWPSDNKIVAYK